MRVNRMTSIDTAPPVVGRALRGLFALFHDRFAITSLRSAAWPGVGCVSFVSFGAKVQGPTVAARRNRHGLESQRLGMLHRRL